MTLPKLPTVLYLPSKQPARLANILTVSQLIWGLNTSGNSSVMNSHTVTAKFCNVRRPIFFMANISPCLFSISSPIVSILAYIKLCCARVESDNAEIGRSNENFLIRRQSKSIIGIFYFPVNGRLVRMWHGRSWRLRQLLPKMQQLPSAPILRCGRCYLNAAK